MTVIIQDGLSPAFDFTHARILHSGNWRNPQVIRTTGTAPGYSVDAVNNTLTYEKWKSNNSTERITFDFGTDRLVSCLGIAGHDFGSRNCTLQVLYSDDDIDYTQLIPATEILDDSPIIAFFDSGEHQYLRIRMVGDAPMEAAVVKWGGPLVMQRPIFSGNVVTGQARQTILRSNYSETGEVLGRTKQRTYLSTGHTWRHLPGDWIRSAWPNLQEGVESEPFWIAWRPENGDCAFAQADEVPIPEYMGIRDLMSVSLSYRALAYE